MKIIYSASISLLASARSASAATAFNQGDCEKYCNFAHQMGHFEFRDDCMANCAKSCDGGFDLTVCKQPCDHLYSSHCMDNCDAKACSASSSSECDANLVTAKSELAAMTSERDAAKECKAKSPNYKAPVNDECNPKNCDEWDCGQWCVCYNADDDAIYERLGCAADDEETCQCD